jgi:methylthioribose-1-phosphate isomerase
VSIDQRAPKRVETSGLSRLPPTVVWVGEDDGILHLLDQTLLPRAIKVRTCTSDREVFEAIRELCVRGAPAIGVAAAFGLCLGTRAAREQPNAAFLERVRASAEYLKTARPTAVNLAWAVDRTARVATQGAYATSNAAWRAMLAEAQRISDEDRDACRRIGEIGASLVRDGCGVLTHCNAGALATVAYGTALAPLYVAHELGRRFRVFADETRPLLQGARLTALELTAAGIDTTVLCDGAAASLMSSGQVQLVIVGADRIAANGDTANKIGTFPLALAARHHGIPFYVAAPLSTIDASIRSGREIPIEQRAASEVTDVAGCNIAAAGIAAYNPAFDVTPAELITGLLTPVRLVQPVNEAGIRAVLSA